MKKVLLLLVVFVFSTATFAQKREIEYQAATQNSVVNNDLIDFKVYPNPTKNGVTVNMGEIKGGISFQINDAFGALVYNRKIVSHDLQKDRFKLDMSSFKEGVYMFYIKTKTLSKTIKVVKL